MTAGKPGAAETATDGRFSPTLLLAAIALVAVNMRVTITGVGPLLTQMSETTGNSVAVLSTLTSVPVLAWAVLSPFAHPAARRFGLNRVVLGALVLLVIGTAVRSLPGPEFSLWFGTALIGVALAVANVLLPAVVKRSFGTRVPLVTSLYTALFAGCGAVAAGTVVPLSRAVEPAGGDAGWRFALAAVVATLPVAVILWIAHMRDVGPDTGHRRPGRHERGPSIWGDPVAWIVGGYMGVQAIQFYVMITWLAPFARSLGRSELVAGFDSMIFQMVGVIGSLGLPLVMRGRMERWVPAALPLLTIAGIGGILLAPEALIVWIVLAGLCSGASIACALTLMATRAPDHPSASALSGMAQSVGYVIAALAPIAFGALHAATGGWAAPFLFVLAAAGGQLALGLAAGRDRHVFERTRG